MTSSHNVHSDSEVGVRNILATPTRTQTPLKTFDSDQLWVRLCRPGYEGAVPRCLNSQRKSVPKLSQVGVHLVNSRPWAI